MKIWAHRGCSLDYPENTLTAFKAAADLFDRGLSGIETDIQLTKDKKMVVIHDETIDRTTNGKGFVKDYTLEELRQFKIDTGDPNHPEHIPSIEEVLDLLEEPFRGGLKLNIELKNSIFAYEGMEEWITYLIRERGLEDSVIYSSFSVKSVSWMHHVNPKAHIGLLGGQASTLLQLLKIGCGAQAIHPYSKMMDLDADAFQNIIGNDGGNYGDIPVRAWFTGSLYPVKQAEPLLDIGQLKYQGITDIFVNNPDKYI